MPHLLYFTHIYPYYLYFPWSSITSSSFNQLMDEDEARLNRVVLFLYVEGIKCEQVEWVGVDFDPKDLHWTVYYTLAGLICCIYISNRIEHLEGSIHRQVPAANTTNQNVHSREGGRGNRPSFFFLTALQATLQAIIVVIPGGSKLINTRHHIQNKLASSYDILLLRTPTKPFFFPSPGTPNRDLRRVNKKKRKIPM